jgi:uncharacterized protein (DUF58 family)
MEFEEVRQYVPGDDVRCIDWKVTARSRAPFIKMFREERELCVVIALDVSASTRTGTHRELREHLIARVGAVLSSIALQNKDRVGLVTFSDTVHNYFPPKKGRGMAYRLVHEALATRSEARGTSFKEVCHYLSRVLPRRCVVFFLTDLFDSAGETALALLARKHEVTVMKVRDPSDKELPRAGLLQVEDPESGARVLLDTTSHPVREAYRERVLTSEKALTERLRGAGVEVVELVTNRPFIPELRRFFERRAGAR